MANHESTAINDLINLVQGRSGQGLAATDGLFVTARAPQRTMPGPASIAPLPRRRAPAATPCPDYDDGATEIDPFPAGARVARLLQTSQPQPLPLPTPARRVVPTPHRAAPTPTAPLVAGTMVRGHQAYPVVATQPAPVAPSPTPVAIAPTPWPQGALLDRDAWCADQWSQHHIATHRVRALSVSSLYRHSFVVELRAVVTRFATPLAALALIAVVVGGYFAMRDPRRAEAARPEQPPVVMSVAPEALDEAMNPAPNDSAIEPSVDVAAEPEVVAAAEPEVAAERSPRKRTSRAKRHAASAQSTRAKTTSSRPSTKKSRRRFITVDASTPLGGLRPGR